ncbi:MAG TPA: hypothetical protein VF178_07960, partial [Gemmatimonadaceae bacterium]
MTRRPAARRLSAALGRAAVALVLAAAPLSAQRAVIETRDPNQQQDPDFERAYKEWTSEPRYGSPLVD